MRAVDVGVGHDDDALVAQPLVAVEGAGAAAQRLDQVCTSWFSRSLSAEALATFRIFPRNGRIAWVSRLRAALAEPPAESPSTRKISVPIEAELEQSASLPGRRSLTGRRLALLLAVLLAPQPLLGLGDDVLEQDVAGFLVAGQPVLEIVADHGLDQLGRLDADQLLLGLAWNCGCSMKIETRPAAPSKMSSAVMTPALAVAGQLGITLQPAQQALRKPDSCVPPSAVGTVLQ